MQSAPHRESEGPAAPHFGPLLGPIKRGQRYPEGPVPLPLWRRCMVHAACVVAVFGMAAKVWGLVATVWAVWCCF
jgi:hypothetical protein